jgi:tetratricopeptide (TPR) repeat protein
LRRQDSPPAEVRSFASWEWLIAAALVVAVFLAYQPAWRGGFIWDDDTHLLNNPVLKPGGVFRTWVPGTYVNYWPVTSTAYWVQYELWGPAPVGFHLVNIALHSVSAILIWRVLALMRVPGAMLAAALFAMHPVNVESVAWITQLKNTLSLALTLLSVLLYLLNKQRGGRRLFVAAVVVFGLATLAKGMTLTLPVVLLACVWWQQGRIERRDLRRVAPFLLIGLMMVGIEVFQQHVAAADDIVRSDGLLSRIAIAGCAVWFYLWKLVWPIDLMFVYPRWNLDAVGPLWFLPGLSLAAIFVPAWRRRNSRGRPVLMVLVCYVALLLPALGFVNIYFMEYSLVADHWQYAAMIVPCAALASTAAATWSQRHWSRRFGTLLCLALLATLATLTWRQSRMYTDIDTLYRTTIERNPACWLVHNNLGVVLADRAQVDEAIAHYRKALEINPNYAKAHYNLGTAFVGLGRFGEAMAQYRKALEINPNYAEAHYNLGTALVRLGRIDEAMAQYQKAVKLNPNYAEAHYNLGNELAKRGRLDEAIAHYQKAVEINPNDAKAHYNLGTAFVGLGRLGEAMAQYRKVLEINPNDAKAHYNLGLALARRGQVDEAVTHFQQALKIKPDYALAHYQLGIGLATRRQFAEAMLHYRKALEIKPDYAAVHNNVAWLLATCPQASLRNGAEAIKHAQQANRLNGGRQPELLDTLAAAYAEAGRFPEALSTARKALDLATRQKAQVIADTLRARIALYEAGKPYRQTPAASTPPPKP